MNFQLLILIIEAGLEVGVTLKSTTRQHLHIEAQAVLVKNPTSTVDLCAMTWGQSQVANG